MAVRDWVRLTNAGFVVALVLAAGATITIGDFVLGWLDVSTVEGAVSVVLVVCVVMVLLSLAHLVVAVDNLSKMDDLK